MTPFEHHSVPRIIFGVGEFDRRAADLAAALGRRPLIVYNGDQSLAQRLADSLTSATLLRQRGEPTVADVDRAVEHAKSHDCDSVIAIGGGSAIDAAKATAGLLTNGGSAVDYMEVIGQGKKITKPAAPWIAIPTTAGTGAEATRNAVIGLPEKKFKASIRSELLLPRVALVDPNLGVNVPPHVTAASGMDALCQLIEAYTSTGATPLTDALVLQAIPGVARSLDRVYLDGQNLDARADMALAALFSGIALANAGLGAVHGFAAPLGANFPAPHGEICGALLPHITQANITALLEKSAGATTDPTLQRYVMLGRLLLDRPDLDDNAALTSLVWMIQTGVEGLHIPPLSKYGLTKSDIPTMVQLAKKASSMRYNPITLSDQALSAALAAAIENPAGN